MVRVVTARARRVYDRWRDAEGTSIAVGCRVEQVEVDRLYGALRCRLHKQGMVIRHGRSCRLDVRFDGEQRPVSIRPHLLRVVYTPLVSTGHIIAQLRELPPGEVGGDDGSP